MKVLITGGAGFIGSHLVDALIAGGHDVIVVDHHRKDKLRFPNPQATIYKLSFQDPGLAQIFASEKPDAVCHLAAQISVTRSVTDPVWDANTNIVSAINVLDLAKQFGCKKFIFASSGGAIYGDHPERPTPEKYDTQPISPYGISKQSFEYYLDLYRQHFGVPTVSLRFSNVYGPRQLSAGEASVIAIFLERLRTGALATIFGDGSTTRDYLFVRDAVEAFVKALTSDFVGTVNIATGEETSVLGLWNLLKEIHGTDHPLEFQPFRAGEVQRSVLSAQTARTAIGWEPKRALRDGLKETYDWYMATFGRN
jgi:UDP-glucose 4-epimerase